MTESVRPSDDASDMSGALWTALAQARALSQGQPAWRWQRIDALARRTQTHGGAVRALLEQRLHALLRQLPAAHHAAPSGQSPPPPAAPDSAPNPPAARARPLRALLEHLHNSAPASLSDAPLPPAPGESVQGAPKELRAVREHRHTWARLRAVQRVAQSQAALPPQAGPMNTQRLLHQALRHMHATSPGYLQHFSTQAEALMWLQNALTPPAAASTPARKARKKQSPR